jgi:hypothetical protein
LTFDITFSLPISLITGKLILYIVHSLGKVNREEGLRSKVKGDREKERIQNSGVRIQESEEMRSAAC